MPLISYGGPSLWRAVTDLYVFCTKTAFVIQNFLNLGDIEGRGENFLTKPPIGTSLLDFTQFEPSNVQIRSRFLLQACARKKGHYRKSQRGYISRICREFPTQPNSTKIGIRIGVADIINRTKFDNDRSRAYKVTDGRILACSIGMACRL